MDDLRGVKAPGVPLRPMGSSGLREMARYAQRSKRVAEGETNMKRIQKPKPQTRRPRPELEPLIDKLDLLTVLGLK